MEIRFEGVRKHRGRFELGPLDLVVPTGRYVVLVGPNGAGKTTLLYLVAGFLSPDHGVVRFDGADVTHRPPETRGAAFVFSEPMLFPHLTVRENVGYSPRGGPRSSREVDSALDLVGAKALAEERPAELSTGQARRVEIARVLASHPDILLLDEPYASIDTEDRAAIAASVKTITAERKITVLHVSHQEEDTSLGDAVLRLRDGRLQG